MNVKRIFNLGMALMMLITSFAVSQPVAAQAPAPAMVKPNIQADAESVPGEVVVAFADSQDMNLVEKIEQAVETANSTDGEVTRLSMDGSAVIQVGGDAVAAAAELSDQPGVLYAEPNYIYSAPTIQDGAEFVASSEYVLRNVVPGANTNGKSIMAAPSSQIQRLIAVGTYPSDTYLTQQAGWFAANADIVWPNTTASANICEIDTGVDYNHPDLSYTYAYSVRVRRRTVTYYATAYRVIPGYDFVNADTNPMDDNGHGTHVAGIMVAMSNNAKGISGVSNGNVVAVKALDAQGVGTNFDIAKAIQYCADRTDVRVINLSLGGPTASLAIHDALLYATTPTTSFVPSGAYIGQAGKGKLVVVAAGNTSSTLETYPAGYSNDPEFPAYSILSVASAGHADAYGELNYSCPAQQSNKNAPDNRWVNVLAPGQSIYSTTPYDVPFYKNYYESTNSRYDYMDGTSMAAAFVSAAAARRMGYKPLETNVQIGEELAKPVSLGGSGDLPEPACTTNEMLDVPRVNVATLLDRAAITASVFDAASGVPLNGASVSVNYLNAGIATSKSSTIAAIKESPTIYDPDLDPNRIFTYYFEVTDILDIPTVDSLGNPITNYQLMVNKAGYTSGYQPAFQQDSIATLTPGAFSVFVNGAVPPSSSSFNVVLGWHTWQQDTYEEATGVMDLDLYVWLPQTPGPDLEQPAPFVVGYGGNAFTYVEGDSYGTLNAFPYARYKREGGFVDSEARIESTTILSRTTHGTILGNSALPYYAGAYSVLVTDYGQIIDHDDDGCGDNYGSYFDPAYDPASDTDCDTGTPGIPLLGAYYTPYAYVWKDGVVQKFLDGSNNFEPFPAGSDCNKHWWKAFAMSSAAVDTVAHYTDFDVCGNGAEPGFIPYSGYTDTNPLDRITLSGLGK
jgi:hypothetical protein